MVVAVECGKHDLMFFDKSEEIFKFIFWELVPEKLYVRGRKTCSDQIYGRVNLAQVIPVID